MEAPWKEIAMDMLSLLTCKGCLCYSMRSLHSVSWLQGLGRSYIAIMMIALQLRVYFTLVPSQHPKEDDLNWVCGSMGELCEIAYEELVLKFGHGCASGVS